MVHGLTIGRIVHFVSSSGESHAAIVTKVWDQETGSSNLTVFVDDNPSPIKRETSRLFSEGGERGTWHWPPRV
jgi:hypothetical protein